MSRYVKSESVEDVEREYQAAKERYNQDKKVYDEQYKGYKDALLADKNKIKEFVDNKIHSAVGNSIDNLEVVVSDYNSNSRGYNVWVRYGEFGPDSSLRWRWRVSVNVETGNVVKESNSWSGLKMTTAAELDDLKLSVKVMETLMSITDEDWKSVLDIDMPKYSDYVEKDPEIPNEFYWEDRKNLAKLSSIIGDDTKAVVVRDSDFYRTDHFASVVKETPKMLVVQYYNKNMIPITEVRVNKDKFLDQMVKPVQIVDVEEQ